MEPSGHFHTGASCTNCHAGRNLHWSACLRPALGSGHTEPPPEPVLTKESPGSTSTKGPGAFPIPPSCAARPRSAPSQTAPSRSILTGATGPIKLRGFRLSMRLKRNQSGTRRGALGLHVSPPPAWGTNFPFPPKAEVCISLAGAETPNASHWNRAKQNSARRSGAEPIGAVLSSQGTPPRTSLSPRPLCSHALHH